MGLAVVNTKTCLPWAGREACQLCVDECNAAGYEAIEFTRVHTETDELGQPLEGTGFLAPVVVDDKCVGCGLCQTRCYGINAQERGVLTKSAIVILAGEGNEDRQFTGAYKPAAAERARSSNGYTATHERFYVPSADKSSLPESETEDDPFGLESN
jgi:NAD-dependent dihydropyrimidine dehydrogenase PreA subunit